LAPKSDIGFGGASGSLLLTMNIPFHPNLLKRMSPPGRISGQVCVQDGVVVAFEAFPPALETLKIPIPVSGLK